LTAAAAALEELQSPYALALRLLVELEDMLLQSRALLRVTPGVSPLLACRGVRRR
jgi:hypothetical protein